MTPNPALVRTFQTEEELRLVLNDSLCLYNKYNEQWLVNPHGFRSRASGAPRLFEPIGSPHERTRDSGHRSDLWVGEKIQRTEWVQEQRSANKAIRVRSNIGITVS